MNMKKILAFVLTLVMVTSLFGGFSAFAAEGNSDIGVRVEKTSDGVDMIVAAILSS